MSDDTKLATIDPVGIAEGREALDEV